MPLLILAMAPKFDLFTKGSKLPLNKGFKNMFELLQSCAQPSTCGTLSKGIITYIQLTLVISNSNGLSEILRDIRTSTYQICRIEKKLNQTTTFNKCICNLTPEVRDILNIFWKRGEIAILLPVIRFSYLIRDQIFTSR